MDHDERDVIAEETVEEDLAQTRGELSDCRRDLEEVAAELGGAKLELQQLRQTVDEQAKHINALRMQITAATMVLRPL